MENRSFLVLCCAALLALLAWFALRTDDRRSVELELPTVATKSSDVLDALPTASVTERSAAIRELAVVNTDVTEPPSASDAAGVAGTVRISGHVMELSGTPVPGVTVVQRDGPESSVTDSAGRFELNFRPSHWTAVLRVQAAEWSTVFECHVSITDLNRDHSVVVAPAIRLGGRVVDSSGMELPWTHLSITGTDRLDANFPYSLDGTQQHIVRGSTGETGTFLIERAPLLNRGGPFKLAAIKRGFVTASIPLPTESTLDLLFVLEAEAVADTAVMEGIVLLPDGNAAVHARVRIGEMRTDTDFEGNFQFHVTRSADAKLALTAGLDGYGPALIESFGATWNTYLHGATGKVRLQLVPDVELRGVLVDARGEPLEGWQISLNDPTQLSDRSSPPEQVEQTASGDRLVETDASGGFRLHGLLQRDYHLRVMQRETLLMFTAGPFTAGDADIILRAPADAIYPILRGTVVDRAGLPIQFAQVSPQIITHQRGDRVSSEGLVGVKTDESGSFTLLNVPKQHIHLSVGGDPLIPQRFDLDANVDPLHVELNVARRCHFRVIASGSVTDDLRYGLVNASGDALVIATFRGGGSTGGHRFELSPGENPVRAVSQDAQRLQVYRGDAVIHEQSIWLDAQGVTEISVELP